MRKELKTGYEGITKIIYKSGAVAYRARKGKGRKSKSFLSLLKARHWRIGDYVDETLSEITSSKTDTSPSFSVVLKRYQDFTFPTLEPSTREFKKSKEFFFQDLLALGMNEITPTVIDEIIRKHKARTLAKKFKRYNFDRELQELKTLFNWYRENEDYTYHNPILKRHRGLGTIKPVKKFKEKMSLEEFLLFAKELRKISILLYDFALVQFFTAARVAEIAGLQKSNVNLKQNTLKIQHTVVWKNSKYFWYLKDYPKNGSPRFCHIADEFRNSLERQLQASRCDFVFQVDGNPVGYRKIQYAYNKALKNCGLYGKYKSTHILRHAMADITRYVMNSLDYAQAVTGHKSITQTERYAGSPIKKQKEAVENVAKLFLEKSEK